MLSLQAVESAIVEALSATAEFKEVGRWSGQLEELLRNPARHPSAWCLFSGSSTGSNLRIGSIGYNHTQQWNVMMFLPQQRGLSSSAEDAVYAPLAAVRQALTGLAIGEGQLWPVSVKLVDVVAGVLIYDMGFTITGEEE